MKRARIVTDQLDTVAGRAGLEVGGWCPDKCARVFDALGDGVQRDHVGGRALEQQQGHRVFGGGRPGDGVWHAGGDLLVKAGLGDGVAGG